MRKFIRSVGTSRPALRSSSPPGNRKGFVNVIEVWVENQQLLELLPPTLAAQYLTFTEPLALPPFVSIVCVNDG
jgi:hypothetical protein